MKRQKNNSEINFNPKLCNPRIKQYLIWAGENGHKTHYMQQSVLCHWGSIIIIIIIKQILSNGKPSRKGYVTSVNSTTTTTTNTNTTI